MLSFLNKNLSNISEELYDKPIVVANHIMIDINFILYNCIKEIEEEVNNIILLICGIPYTDINIIENRIKEILNRPHWDFCDLMLDGHSIDIIINDFKKSVNNNIENIIQIHLLYSLINHINTTHVKEFLKSINIFFDGIPAYSKILEQRRRRMKSYLDSKNKKKILNDNINNFNSILIMNDIIYDYNDWVKSLYSIDMILGPNSPTLINIAKFLEIKLIEYYNTINININDSMKPGEADFKIFKYIIDHKLDCDIIIHSCDSDFIFMVLWYQIINIVKDNNININYINYMGNIKQLYFAKKIINSMMDKYKYFNNINDDVSINIIFDTLAIILMFGNDIMPISYELGSELSLKQLYETHYKLYSVNKFIININDINVISFENLAEWLKYIQETNSFNIIILSRFYKLPYSTIIDESKLENIINDTVLLNNKGFILDKNPYQSYYNYVCGTASNMTEDMFNRPFKIFFDKFSDANNKYVEITKNKNVEEYLSFYISLCIIYFYNFDLYSPFNLLYYGDILAPSISMIIDYITKNNMNTIIQNCYNILKTPVTEYFNPLSHHIFITPYILEYHIDGIEMYHLEIMLNMIENEINGIWYRENYFFNLKKIDPKTFIHISNNLIYFYKYYYLMKFNNKTSINYNVN